MKKMLFSAIAMIAFAGSAFASNEVESENQSNTTIKDKVVTVEGTPLLDVTDISCYSRLCGTIGSKKVCTEWVKVDCANLVDDAKDVSTWIY